MGGGAAQPSKSRRRKWAGFVVVLGLAGLGAFGVYQYRKPPAKPPSAWQVPPFSSDEQKKIRAQMRIVGQQVLGISPEQGEKLREVWKQLPETTDELIEAQRRTNEILTPMQRAVVRPARKVVRDYAIDRILEPARGRFTPQDFEQFRAAVKMRVDQRVAAAEASGKR